MNTQRLLILGLAAVAAGGAALLARGLMGGGTPKVAAALPSNVAMSEVLVASSDLQPGQHLDGSQVRWQSWPKKSIDSSFITQDRAPNSSADVNGTVVRAPIVKGEPITDSKVVHSDAAGIMAASITPGMRALALNVSTDSGAGGFILPNDRVDVIATVQTSEQPKRYRSLTLLENMRVLAMDQTYKDDKGQKVVIAKTATLEVSPDQAESIAHAQVSGTLTLALRGLADSSASALAASALGSESGNTSGPVAILRYGLPRTGGEARGE
jgi:pilus assembly protein CpaB